MRSKGSGADLPLCYRLTLGPPGGRLSDSCEPREDHYATSGGKERMTGTEHEPIMADAAQHGKVPGLTIRRSSTA